MWSERKKSLDKRGDFFSIADQMPILMWSDMWSALTCTSCRSRCFLASSGCEMHMGARISLRPLQRRFKARKKPEGYTSTPTGLKRLKTQITAFHVNANGKGTPSGVPQPIHKRKLVLVKEEFDASSSGGGAENRTPVQSRSLTGVSRLSRRLNLGGRAPGDPRLASQSVRS